MNYSRSCLRPCVCVSKSHSCYKECGARSRHIVEESESDGLWIGGPDTNLNAGFCGIRDERCAQAVHCDGEDGAMSLLL